MSRSIAAPGQYKFGECGFVVDGLKLQDGTKLKNMRIYKQRSHRMYDILNPQSNEIYRKIKITTYDSTGYLLDYSKTNDEILDSIDNNCFFVRAHTDDQKITDPHGFVYKFLYRKIVTGASLSMFDMYTPSCTIIDRDIDNILISPVYVNDTVINGRLFNSSGTINTTGMVLIVTLPDGKEYSTTTIVNDQFSIDVDAIELSGTATITLISDYYNTKTVEFPVLELSEDSPFVTTILISQFESTPESTYKATIPADVHARGSELILQAYNDTGYLVGADIEVQPDGTIVIEQYDDAALELSIIGDTIKTVPFVKTISEVDWIVDGDMQSISIPNSEFNKTYPQIQIYDASNHVVYCEVQIDELENIKISSVEVFDGKIVIVGYNK